MRHSTANRAAPAGGSLAATWKEDLLASAVVFLVALPLSLGLALVAGFPFEKAATVGLISGIIGGVVVGLLSGSPLQVSGAANGAAVMVAIFIKDLGFEALGIIVLVSGLAQIAAGLLRIGQVFRAVSPALIQGMLAGIGVLIFASQFHVMVDDVPPGAGKEFGGIVNLWSLPLAIWKGVSEEFHQPAALIGLLTIAAIILWTAFAPRRFRLLPAPLVGVGLATATASFLDLELKFVPAPDHLLDAVTWPAAGWLDYAHSSAIWIAGLSLAFVASAESLLTATAVDTMQQHAPRTKYDRELVAQGAGNILCGLLGVLPVSGVIVRSSANVLAGGRTRLSTVLHGVWIFLFITLLPGLLKLIPVASLAAVLVYAGIRLIKLGFARALWSQDRAEVGIYAATMGMVVATDLLTGIAVGIGLALARLLYSFSHLEITVTERQDTDTGNGSKPLKAHPEKTRSGVSEYTCVSVVIRLQGAATFMRLPQLAAALETLRPDAHVHVYVHELTFIDHACLDLLVNWEQRLQAAGGELVIDWETLHGVFQRHAWGGNPRSAADA